uniref:Ribosomal protein L5 n=1 Tax=Rhexinema sarcinoideum TaxID=43261 RepID=A0A1B2RYV3_9CHLO|nr:ribosomal protein L5 [Rhexinema sarcinoideum]
MSYSKSFPLIYSSSRKVLIQRSSHFLGHLQKNWVTQNLPRYLLSLNGWKNRLKERFFQLLPNKSNDFLPAKTLRSLGDKDAGKLFKSGKTNFFDKQKSCGPKAKNGRDLLKFFCWQNYKKPSSILNSINLHKIVLHSTSGKLYQSPKHCALLDLTFLTISCQTPTKVYSRKAVAAFKLSKLSLLGVKTTLRNILKHEFFYKFYFLQAAEHSSFMSKAQQKITPLPLFPDILTPLKNISFKSSLKHNFNKVALTKNDLHFTLNKHIDKAQNKKIKPTFVAGLNQTSAQSYFKKQELFKNFPTFLYSAYWQSKEKKANKQTYMFVYKNKIKLKKNNLGPFFTTAVAIKNVFIFNELDSLDYDSFSNLAGFEIMLISRKLI